MKRKAATRGLSSLFSSKWYARASVLVFVMILGTVIVWAQASITWFGFNAEAGSFDGAVSAYDDSAAADGRAIQFTSGQTATTLPNPGTWTDVTSNMTGLSSECGTISGIFAVPGSNKVIAGVARRGLWVSSNDGGSWTQMPGSTTIVNRPTSLVFDPNNPNVMWEAGLYDGPGVNKTTDGGNTFQGLGSDAWDLFSVSVDFSDPTRQRLLAGPRRRSQIVFKSTNGGTTWTNIGANIPGGTDISTHPIFINSTTYLVNTDSTGVYRTTDGGTSWQQMTNLPARRAPLVASDGTIYWSSGDGLVKSTNSGQTWTRVGSGLTENFTPIELPDGRLVSRNGNSLLVSANGGSSWTSFGATLPPTNGASGFTDIIYSPSSGAFYGAQFTCDSTVHAGAVMRLR